LKIDKLLAGTLALVLVAGLGTPVFAEPPLDSDSTVLSQQVFVTSGDTTINFDALTQADILVGNEFAGQGVVFLTPDLNLQIGSTATGGSLDNSLGASLNQPLDFSGQVVIFFTDNNCASDLQFFIFNEPYSATAFDIDGNILATLNDGEGTVLGLGEVFSFAGMQVQTVETSGTFYAIDDVSFTLEKCIVDNDNGQVPVGGELIPIETTSLILAGAQTFSWMIPVILSVLGIGLFVVSRKSE